MMITAIATVQLMHAAGQQVHYINLLCSKESAIPAVLSLNGVLYPINYSVSVRGHYTNLTCNEIAVPDVSSLNGGLYSPHHSVYTP